MKAKFSFFISIIVTVIVFASAQPLKRDNAFFIENKNGIDWYLVKDSGLGSRNNSNPGYYFFQ